MFGGSKKNKISFLIDFRSSSIGYALVEENSTVSFVKFYNRKNIFFKNIENIDIYIDEFYKNLNEILISVFEKNLKLKNSVDEIKILFGSPWYEAKYKNIIVSNNPSKITQKYIEDLIIKNITQDKGEVPIEKIISNFTINGYELQNPINKKAKEFGFSAYESFVSEKTKSEIEKLLYRFFPRVKISYFSHPNILMNVVKKQYPEISNYMSIDIGGEITEINIVNNDRISNFFYIPMGSHYVVRKLINSFGYSEATAFSKLGMIFDSHIDEQSQNNEHALFKDFINEWLKEIKSILDQQNVSSTPSNIFILADQEIKNAIKDSIDKPEGYAGSLKNNIKPLSRLLDYDADEGLIKFQESKKRDSTLNIFCEFLRIHSE